MSDTSETEAEPAWYLLGEGPDHQGHIAVRFRQGVELYSWPGGDRGLSFAGGNATHWRPALAAEIARHEARLAKAFAPIWHPIESMPRGGEADRVLAVRLEGGREWVCEVSSDRDQAAWAAHHAVEWREATKRERAAFYATLHGLDVDVGYGAPVWSLTAVEEAKPWLN